MVSGNSCVICHRSAGSRSLGGMCKKCNQKFLMLVAAHDYGFDVNQSIIEQILEEEREILSQYVEHVLEIRDTPNK